MALENDRAKANAFLQITMLVDLITYAVWFYWC